MGKMKRLIVAGMLAVGLVAGLLGEANAGEAAEYSVPSEDTIAGTNWAVLARNDTQQPEIVTLDNFDTSDIADEEENIKVITKAASVDEQEEWSCFSSYKVYNCLTEEERQVWDSLDAECMSLLVGTETADYESQIYWTSYVESTSLTTSQLENLAFCFRYSNPQYYFLSNYYAPKSRRGKKYIRISIYDAFADGEARAQATEQLKQQADIWLSESETCETELEKAIYFHDAISKKVDYDNEFVKASSTNQDELEETHFTQSAYSVFCKNATVCSGYSQAYEMLCNAAGIEAIAVTSEEHAWNKIRVEDSWYNVDLTWDDNSTISYQYFMRSDAVYLGDKQIYREYHTVSDLWNEYLPACTLDTGSTAASVGELPETTDQVSPPEIQISKTILGKYIITLSSTTDDAEIYYTTDGTEPSQARTKSYRYSESFKTADATMVRAVAVHDTMYDSDRTLPDEEDIANAVVVEDEEEEETESSDNSSSQHGSSTNSATENNSASTGTSSYNDSATDGDNTSSTGNTISSDSSTSENSASNNSTSDSSTSDNSVSGENAVKKGTIAVVGNSIYKVTGTATVSLTGVVNHHVKVYTMKKKVKIQGKTYQVTGISARAFENNTYLKKFVVSSRVKKIGKYVWMGCSKLKKLIIKSKKLKKAGLKKKTFVGIKSKTILKVPASKKKAYQKLFRKKGLLKKVNIS